MFLIIKKCACVSFSAFTNQFKFENFFIKITSKFDHVSFDERPNTAGPLSSLSVIPSPQCTTFTYKSVLEIASASSIPSIAAFVVSSKNFYSSSSFIANFALNFRIDKDTIKLFHLVFPTKILRANQDSEVLEGEKINKISSLHFLPSICVDLRNIARDGVEFQLIISLISTLANPCQNKNIDYYYFRKSLRSISLIYAICELVQAFSSSTSLLENKNIDSNANGDEENRGMIDSQIESDPWPNLTSIHLSGYNVYDTTLKILSTEIRAKHVTRLEFEWCGQLSDVGISFLTTGAFRNVNYHGSENLESLSLRAKTFCASLKVLIFRGCDRITDEGLALLGSSQELSKSLTHLSFENCGSIFGHGFEKIAKNFESLTYVNFSSCYFLSNVVMFQLLAEENVEKYRENLKILDISNCFQITGDVKKQLHQKFPDCEIIS